LGGEKGGPDDDAAAGVIKRLSVESLEWTKLDWIRNPSVMVDMASRQEAFWKDPMNFIPRPFVYRPILAGMGWGNFVYGMFLCAILLATEKC